MTLRSLLDRLLSAFGRRRAMTAYKGQRGVGQEWERLAEKHLKAAGYRILERNVRMRVGEIDFVASEGETLCFIEVKGRHGLGFGLPEEAVNAEKQRKIFRVAEAYLQRHCPERSTCRFDVVSILEDTAKPRVQILRGAFEGPPRPRPRR
jgi:putative endonuclease